jgi:hypothetical protein
MSALTNQQKQRLAILAREAYAKAPQRDRDAADFNDWRHEQVATACGKLGLRCASQADYKAIEAHFLQLVGQEGKALKALVRSQTEGRRQAEYKLVKECESAGFHISYAEKICWNQNRCSLFDASEKQIWKVFFTVRNRKNGKAKAKANVEHSTSNIEHRTGEEREETTNNPF